VCEQCGIVLIDRTPQRYFCNVREIELKGKRDEREPTLRDSAVTLRYLSASIERALDVLLPRSYPRGRRAGDRHWRFARYQ
jgi:hypothetical protein